MNDTKRRPYTKPVLLLLIAYYVVAAEEISWVLLLALFTSWLGDVLLIPKGHKWFMIGGTSFLISHFLFMATYIPHVQWNAVPWLIIVAAAVVYFTISYFIVKAIRPTTPAKMVWPMARYLIINSFMNLFAMMRMLSSGTPGSYVGYLGAVLFFASDCTLFLVRYFRNPDVIFKRHFTVMLTYLAGELLIVLGLLMG
jgi:uncharacterized membrane protein YhhN